MFDIRIYGDPVLRKNAKPVTVFDAALAAFAEELAETMKERDGVGLAAPQVGESLRVIAVDATNGEKPPLVLVNPEVTGSSGNPEDYEEGCLSIPDIRLKIKRPPVVSVKAHDIHGKPVTITDATDLFARALQHEIDHLNGIMIIDHISPLQRQMLSGKLKKMAKEQRAAVQ